MDSAQTKELSEWPWGGVPPKGWSPLHQTPSKHAESSSLIPSRSFHRTPHDQQENPSSVMMRSASCDTIQASHTRNVLLGADKPVLPRSVSMSSSTLVPSHSHSSSSFFSSPIGSLSYYPPSPHPGNSSVNTSNEETQGNVKITAQPKLPPLEAVFYSRPNVPSNNGVYTVRITNVSWETRLDDIQRLFAPLPIPIGHVAPHYTHGVHFMVDRLKSRLGTDCYVEFPSLEHASRALSLKSVILRGRHIDITPVPRNHFLEALFPLRQSIQEPVPSSSTNGTLNNDATDPPETAPRMVYVTREEVLALLTMCKSVRHHPLRRYPDRPFEAVISIISKIPWRNYKIISLQQRDHIFEMLKLSIESLKIHMKKEISFHSTLLERLVRSGLAVPLFTEKQKSMLLTTSNLPCPKDMSEFVYLPIPLPSSQPHAPSTELSSSSVSFSNKASPNLDAVRWDPFYGTSIDTPCINKSFSSVSVANKYPTPPETQQEQQQKQQQQFFRSSSHHSGVSFQRRPDYSQESTPSSTTMMRGFIHERGICESPTFPLSKANSCFPPSSSSSTTWSLCSPPPRPTPTRPYSSISGIHDPTIGFDDHPILTTDVDLDSSSFLFESCPTTSSPSTETLALSSPPDGSLDRVLASFHVLERKCVTTFQAYMDLERKHEALKLQYEQLERSRLEFEEQRQRKRYR